ncbi:MAG: hypothetical protein QM831_11230 [Kofleriaceae bacterium]
MIFLAPAIVFAGVAGNHHEQVERQLAPVLAKIGVTTVAMSPADLAQLARHSDRAKEIVTAMHVDGVIGGALVTAGGSLTFRIVIYDGHGNMRSLDETPLAKAQLSRDDLEVLSSNLGGEVEDLGKLAPKEAPAKPKPEPKPELPPPPPPPAPTPAPTAAPTTVAEPKWDADEPAKTEPTPPSDDNAVSMSEIEAMTGGGDPAAPTDTGVSATAPSSNTDTLHLELGAGFALIGRSFGAPAGLQGYSSSPVGGAHFTGGICPTAHTLIDFDADRTLGMSTTLASGNATTVISRWDASVGYRFAAQLAGTIGLGHRGFSIASSDPGRSPDNEYNYLAFGARLQQPIGRFTLHGNVAFEPVFAGTDGMEMTLGPSSRWGLDLGVGVDVRLTTHVVAHAAFDYQRFSWSWDAGDRGASGAADSYPSASLGLATEL